MSAWIVRRESSSNGQPRHEAWTGPFKALWDAEHERDAWIEAGRLAEVVPYTIEVAKQVRRWAKGLERRPYDERITR